MRIGLILGGGGEVGIAWEIGVLAALETEAGFSAGTSDVIAGTSAGAIVGTYAAQGRSMLELSELERHGNGVPVGAGFGAESGGEAEPRTIPEDITSALMSTEGTLEERGARLGKLALQAPVSLREAAFVAGFETMLGSNEWPQVDFRPTTVQTESGQTTLWDKTSGIGLAAAVATSCAVPGVFPPVGFGGHHFIDVPRRPFSGDLIKAKSLDAIIFVGLILPLLANNNEQKDELAEQAVAGGLGVAAVTGGAGLSAIATDLLDYAARPRAVEVGLEDGRHAAPAVRALMSR